MQYVHFSRGIEPASTLELVTTLANLAQGDRDVYLLINSNGGNVLAGIHCYNMIRALPINLTAHNVGNVDSITNVVFLAAATRVASPPSTFMFHSVGFDITSPTRFEERNLRESLDSVTADNRRMSAIIADRTHLTTTQAATLFRQQRVRDAAWAQKKGFIHEIHEALIPDGTNVHQLI